MPIACNPWLEANQREGKVFVKQSQALSLSRSLSSSPLGTRCLSFIPFWIQPSFSQLCSPVCIWFLYVSQLRSRDGAQAQPRGAAEEGNPQDNWSGHGQPETSSHPYSTLYFPGKHLLSSLAQKLASNLPPHSCLVMPIRVYTALRSRDEEERR